MISPQQTIFPIKFNYNGVGFETKVLKHTYRQHVLYKMIMPSAVSAVQQCWIATDKEGGQGKLIMGAIDQSLMQHIITAISKQEQMQAIYDKDDTEASEQKLRSA